MGHKHNVFDTDPHFLIDPVTKRIKNESSQKTTLIQRDHNSERFSFEIPEIDGHDMSKCNSVEVHYNNIDAQGNQNRGVYKVTDMKWTDDRTKVVFTWLISENATQLVGRLHFLIVFECVEDGVVVYRWQTLINSDFEIAEGMDNSGEVIETYPDIVAQWEAQIFGNAANAVSNINLAEQNAIEAVRTEGAAQVENVRATAQGIAAERTQIHLNNALKASVIEGGADGEVICLDDSAEQPFVEMSVFGKSTQKKTEGHQLFDAEQIPSTTSRGVILTNNNDGSFTITGESETITGAYFGVYKEYTHEEMVSMLKAGVLTLRVEATSYPYAYAMIRKDGANLITISNANQTSHAATIKEEYLVDETYTFRIGFYGLLDANITNGVAIKPMLYQEGDGTWEEFSGGIPSPNPEYPQEINGVENPTITVKDNEENEQNLSLPYTLHGIPVTSGGNYTDADGQEWICDEVDFAKRKYIQRCEETVLDGETSVLSLRGEMDNTVYVITKDNNRYIPKTNLLCDKLPMKNTIYSAAVEGIRVEGTESSFGIRFRIATERLSSVNVAGVKEFLTSNPMRVVAPLVEPIEIPLSDAEIEAFKALKTKYPYTTILNDSGANMAVRYGIDTKTYIDKKFAELQAMIQN